MGCRNSYHSITKSCQKPDCRDVKGHTLYEVEKIITSELDQMLVELVSWDAATKDYPEVMTGAMLSELLLAPHNIAYSGLSYGAWAPVDPADDPGLCRCLTL